jgi:hypothetical protein
MLIEIRNSSGCVEDMINKLHYLDISNNDFIILIDIAIFCTYFFRKTEILSKPKSLVKKENFLKFFRFRDFRKMIENGLNFQPKNNINQKLIH